MTQAHEAAADELEGRAMTNTSMTSKRVRRRCATSSAARGRRLAEMTRQLGSDVVPAGFVVTTEACVEYMRASTEPPELEGQVTTALARLEAKELGRAAQRSRLDPLLLSVAHSGARESMPGTMDTVLNLGLTDESVVGLARVTGNDASHGTRTGASCRCSSNIVHGVRPSGSRVRSRG